MSLIKKNKRKSQVRLQEEVDLVQWQPKERPLLLLCSLFSEDRLHSNSRHILRSTATELCLNSFKTEGIRKRLAISRKRRSSKELKIQVNVETEESIGSLSSTSQARGQSHRIALFVWLKTSMSNTQTSLLPNSDSRSAWRSSAWSASFKINWLIKRSEAWPSRWVNRLK